MPVSSALTTLVPPGWPDDRVESAIDSFHGCQNLPSRRGFEMRVDESGMVRRKMTRKPSGSTLQPIDAERVGQRWLAGILYPRHTAIAGAQYHRRCAVAEQADGNNVWPW